MPSLFEIRENIILSTSRSFLMKTVELQIMTWKLYYRAPSRWVKLPSEYKLANSLKNFRSIIKI